MDILPAPVQVALDQANRNDIDVTSVRRAGPVTTIGVRVGGHGYDGGGAFAFTVEGDRVSRMAITG